VSNPWYLADGEENIPTPALLIFPERIEENLRHMIEIAGSVERLRPHLKTHKMKEVTRMQIAAGIGKFKCATIAEAEMGATCGAKEILLAYPSVGPRAKQLRQLVERFSEVCFSTLADCPVHLDILSDAFAGAKKPCEVFLDLDCGMGRTGIKADREALELYRSLAKAPNLIPAGLHAYDGHVHDADLETRRNKRGDAMAPVHRLRNDLEAANLPVPCLIAGGSPTFAFHAMDEAVDECSPGTTLLWDYGYSDAFPDLPFRHAAVLLARVSSKPGANRLCLDLGHKAVASEKPLPVRFLEEPEAVIISHSEEHLVLETPRAESYEVGDRFHGLPRHVCPTVALYDEAQVVSEGHLNGTWEVIARRRAIHVSET
jgi:D-serine deaminase-like pyridoxal phosphate-dependent protein